MQKLMKRLVTHVPDPLHAALQAKADRERRSLSNLVSFLLEKAMLDEGQPKPDQPDAK